MLPSTYPLIKNCSFVTESKNLDPLMTIGFKAKLELAAQANSKMVAEILILRAFMEEGKVVKKNKREKR